MLPPLLQHARPLSDRQPYVRSMLDRAVEDAFGVVYCCRRIAGQPHAARRATTSRLCRSCGGSHRGGSPVSSSDQSFIGTFSECPPAIYLSPASIRRRRNSTIKPSATKTMTRLTTFARAPNREGSIATGSIGVARSCSYHSMLAQPAGAKHHPRDIRRDPPCLVAREGAYSGHCCNTRVRCRIVSQMRGRCWMAAANRHRSLGDTKAQCPGVPRIQSRRPPSSLQFALPSLAAI
jgi:hypothetical protein